MAVKWHVFCLALVVLAACDGGKGIQPGFETGPEAFLRGEVTDTGGTPVAAARVAYAVFRPSNDSIPLILGDTLTNAVGAYGVLLDAEGVTPFEGRVLVGITPPENSMLLPDTVQDTVSFRSTDEPRDTLVIDVVLLDEGE